MGGFAGVMAKIQSAMPETPPRQVRSTVLVAVLRFSTYLSAAVTAVLVARLLGPRDRGVWAVALLFGSMVALASELGIGLAVLRLARQNNLGRGGVIASGLVLALATSLLATTGASVATYLHVVPGLAELPLATLALALVSVVPTNVSTVCRQALLEDGDLLGVAGSQAAQALLALSLICGGFYLIGLSVIVAISGFVIAQVVLGLVLLIRCVQRDLVSSEVSGVIMRDLLRYGVQAHVGNLALFLTYRVDLLLVNRVLGPASAGIYSIALTLSEVLRVLPEAGQMRVFSRRSTGASLSEVLPVARTVVLMTLLGGLVTAILGLWLVPLLFGAPFAEAPRVFMALIPGLAALAVSYCLSPVLLLRGRIAANSTAACISLLVMIGCDLIAIPRWGLVAAAYVSSVAYGVLAFLQVCLVRREEHFPVRLLMPGIADISQGFALLPLGQFRRLWRTARHRGETVN